MELKQKVVTDEKSRSQVVSQTQEPTVWSASLAWWYRLAAPPEPLMGANFSQRERVRHGRQAAITVPIFIFFMLTLTPQVLSTHDPLQMIVLVAGLMLCCLILVLNRKGFVRTAGVLALLLLYTGGTYTLFSAPGGITLSNTYTLDFTIIPDLLALAFFSANSLLLVVSLNAFQVWFVMTYAHHDAAIGHLLRTAPGDIYVHIYVFQFITAIALYIWARNTEAALKRADRAEEIIAFERRESERRELELEQRRELDAGIQHILQTHVAVANGDLTVRAPLHQDHALWQVAAALNNLISRLQSLSLSERELRHQMHKEDERKFEHTQARTASIPKVKG
jgi:hypothetical protein